MLNLSLDHTCKLPVKFDKGPHDVNYLQLIINKAGIVEAARYRRNETCRLFARNPLIGQTGSNRGVFVYISWLEYTFHFDSNQTKIA